MWPSVVTAWTQDSYRLRVTWPSVVTKLGLSGWDQLCTNLDQLLINLLLGRVFTILRQFDYWFFAVMNCWFRAVREQYVNSA
jgi:hypothetical protein